MPKLNFSGNLLNTIKKHIKDPAVNFSIIQDGVQDGHQKVKTAISRLAINFMV